MLFPFFILLVLLQIPLFPSPALADEMAVDNLQNSAVGQFPSGWKTYPFHYGKAQKVYKMAENGEIKFIRAEDSEDISVPIFKDFNWDLNKYPYLKFRWRAQKLPAGASESSPATNDSGCGVYVGFGHTSALKYVWSSTLPVGSYWAKKPGKFYIIVRESGGGNIGHWREVMVNVPEDYKKYFQSDKKKTPSGIGVMSDGNAVHKPAACDYADFRIATSP